MRIAYVITRADEIGGAQVHVRDLATAMHHAGHDVAVIAGRPGALSDQLAERGVRFCSAPALVRELRPGQDFTAFLELKALLARLRVDLVSTHSSKAGWLGRLAATALRLPVLFTAHGWAFTDGVPWLARGAYGLAERLAGPLADQIITVSEYDRVLALQKRIAAPEKIIRIHNGVHDRGVTAPSNAPGAGARIVMVGRFSDQKNHPRLLRVLATLRELDWALDLVGDGPLQAEAIALAESLGIAGRVRFLGERRDVHEVLRGADLYALISNWEGLPRSMLEAMSVGLPVLASNVGGVSEAVREGQTGYLVPRNDDRLLTERLALLIAQDQVRRALGTAGRRLYETNFRFELMLERTLAVYQQMLASKPCGLR